MVIAIDLDEPMSDYQPIQSASGFGTNGYPRVVRQNNHDISYVHDHNQRFIHNDTDPHLNRSHLIPVYREGQNTYMACPLSLASNRRRSEHCSRVHHANLTEEEPAQIRTRHRRGPHGQFDLARLQEEAAVEEAEEEEDYDQPRSVKSLDESHYQDSHFGLSLSRGLGLPIAQTPLATYINVSFGDENDRNPPYRPRNTTYSTVHTLGNGRKRQRPQIEIRSTIGDGSSAVRAGALPAPRRISIPQDKGIGTDDEGFKSPTPWPSHAPRRLHTPLSLHPNYPHLFRTPNEKYQSMDRETMFKQKCQKVQVKGYPHMYEPLPEGLQHHEVITQYPNHLHGPLLLEVAEFWTPKEITNAVGTRFLTPNTVAKRISAAKARRDGKMTKGTTQVMALKRADRQHISQGPSTTTGIYASEPSTPSGTAVHSPMVESDASRRTRELQEAALAEDPDFFMRIEGKKLSSRRSSRKSFQDVSVG